MRDKIFIAAFFIIVSVLVPLIIPTEAEETRLLFPETLGIYITETESLATVTAEEYIVGCLSAQIPIDYEQEALNAQAAAAATYALRLIQDFSESGEEIPLGADLSDDASVCQPYYTPEKRLAEYGEDYEKYREKLETAALFGINTIMTYESEPIYSVYHSVSAGKTADAEYIWNREIPYLTPVESAADIGYIHYECKNEMTADKVRKLFVEYDSGIEVPADFSKWFSEFNASESGYVISTRIGSRVFSGGDIWRILGLRSSAFTVEYKNGIFTFVTRGYGHGAGLSQYGANDMAKKGATAREILLHYYGETVEIPEI